MTLTHSAAESLARLGRYQEIVTDGGRDLSRIHRLASIDHRLVLADSLAKTGHLDTARDVITPILQSSPSDPVSARCNSILGWIARERGQVEEAAQRFQQAARLCRDSGNVAHAALCSVLLFRIVSERQAPQSVGPLLTEARILVTKSGDAHLAAFLHESVARQETQIGNYDEARRHLKTAMGLVASHPNAWLEQLCLINAFCIAFYDCDLPVAEKHLLRAGALVDVTGAFEMVIQNNQGHLYLHQGRLSKAENLLQRVSQRASGQAAESALDGLARLYLASGRLDDCQSTLARLHALQRPTHSASSFPFRSSLVTSIRLLLHSERWQEATQTSEIALREGAAADDRHLMAAAHFLRARALAAMGLRADAARSISTSGELGVWGIREYQGIFTHMSGELLQTAGYSTLPSRLFLRAERIWLDHDHARSEFEIRASAAVVDATVTTGRECRTNEAPATILSSVVGAFDLAYSPRLLGAELIDIISAIGCSPDARIVESRANEVESTRPDPRCKLPLGIHRGKRLTLACIVPDDPALAGSLGDVMRLGRSVTALAAAREQEQNRAALWPDPTEQPSAALFVSEELQSLLNMARKVAPTNVPVLITGETGTGKEVLARTIHAYSSRAKAAFLPFNCSSTPRDMLDSQLFGHRRGAFTGATEHFQGVIRSAAAGTLFLDEIGDMGLDVQPKLLRFLESNEVHPVGEVAPVAVDVRVIAATNAPLDVLVAEGRFREDLFYRLNIVRLHLPPLRERRVEIPSLAVHYLAKHARECGKGDLRLAEETIEYLVLYRWPGNVRQLANEMRRLAVLAEPGAVMMPEHLSAEIAASRRTIPASQRSLDPTEVVVRLDQPMAAGVQHLERAMIQYALHKCGGRMEETAAMLGLSRKGLYLKRQRFGILPPEAISASEVA